jgi:hypothetical protein
MIPAIHSLGELVVSEIDDYRDMPGRTRDWNFEGRFSDLVKRIQKDSQEYGCRRYTVMEEYPDGCALWLVWRES